MKPEGDVDHGIDVRPERGRQGRTLLLGEEAAPARQQVTEVARITPGVTEYRRPCLGWVAWGTYPQAAWPATRPRGSLGPRVQATGGYVTGRLGANSSTSGRAGGLFMNRPRRSRSYLNNLS